MDSRVERYGRALAFLLFVIEMVAIIVFAIVTYSFVGTESILAMLFSAVILVLMGILNKSGAQEKLFCFVFVFGSSALSLFMAIATRNSMIILIIYMLQWPVITFFQSRISCGVTALIQSTGLCVISLVTHSELMNYRQLLTFVCGVLLCMWFMLLLVGALKNKEEKLKQQDRSNEGFLAVTEAMYDEVREATDSKTDFMLHLSRIVRSPVRSILSEEETLAELLKDENAKESLHQIEENGKTLLGISEGLMEFSMLEKGKMILKKESVSLPGILSRILKENVRRLDAKGIDLKLTLPKRPTKPVIGDESRIYYILSSLVENAVKYTSRGSVHILIKLDDLESGRMKLECVVSDTGCGMRASDAKKVFTPFFQAENRTIHNSGAGLSLYLSKELVKLMEGELEFHSEYGTGSVFSASMILTEDEQAGEEVSLYEEAEKFLLHKRMAELEAEEKAQKRNQSEEDASTSGEADRKEDSSDKADELPLIPGVDWAETKVYLPSTKIILVTAAQLYKKGNETVHQVRELFYEYKASDSSESRNDYRIKVHAIKGMCKTFGASALSEEARLLEFAARDENREYILNQTENFLEDYENFIVSLKVLPGVAGQEEQKELPPFDAGEVSLGIKTIEKALLAFDMETADAAMEQLKKYSYPHEMEEVIRELENHVLNLDAAGVRKEEEKLQIWLKKS